MFVGQFDEGFAARQFAWIIEQLDAGRTVYAASYLRVWRVAPKHRHLLRLNGNQVEIARGRRWDIITGCRFTAQ